MTKEIEEMCTMTTSRYVLDTRDQIAVFRLKTLRSALKLEMKGLKRRGKSAYSIIKNEFGLKGNRESVLEQLNKIIEQ